MLIRTLSRSLLRKKIIPFRTWVRSVNYEGEYSKTSMTMLSQEDDANIYIEAYSPLGFRLNSGFRIFGPCAVFPRSILHWNVAGVEDIHEDSLSLFSMLEPKIDLLVIGVGSPGNKIDPNIIKYLRSKKINLEILPTDQACSTFNFLNSERRYVAAALIPPAYSSVNLNDDNVVLQKDILQTSIGLKGQQDQSGELDGELKYIQEHIYSNFGKKKNKSDEPNNDESRKK
ncbi:hypothetical protein ScPMuIL_007574 [Solemya velum]